MRQVVLTILIISTNAYAIPKLTYEISQDSSQQSLGYSTGQVVSKSVSNTKTVLNLSDDIFKDNYNYSFGLTYNRPDYSSVLVRDRFGVETILNQTRETKAEYSLNTGLGFGKDGHTIDLSFFSNLNDSPYATRGISGGYQYSFYNSTSIIGIKYNLMSQERPEDYYTEPGTFNVLKRPTQIKTKEIGLTFEQAITTKMKSSLKISRVLESEERPSQNKFSGKLGFALSETFFLKTGYGRFIEEDISPKNERGIFQASSIENELIYEYNFDHLFSLSYDLVIEDEALSFNNSITRTAFDQYGIAARSLWTSSLTTNLKFRYAESNFNTNELYFVGGIEWSL